MCLPADKCNSINVVSRSKVNEGGASDETFGRRCLCNSILASVGLGQVGGNASETPILTARDHVVNVWAFLKPQTRNYTAI